MAPELVRKTDYDGCKVDIWALGVLMYTLLVGSFPFRGNSEPELYSRIMRGWYKFPASHKNLSKEARTIISKCLHVDQAKRIDANELASFEWITCIDLGIENKQQV